MSFSGVSGRAVGAVDEGYLDQLAEPREVKTERITDDQTVRGDEEDRQVGITRPTQASLDGWLEETVGAIHEGLNKADRFDASTRRIRCVLAFGELEYLAKRWLRVGWAVDRQMCLRTLTDSWCFLLTSCVWRRGWAL